MSDSFADLWSSSTPLQPKAKSQTLSAAASGPARVPLSQAQAQAGGNKPDVFALLAGSPGNGNRGRYDAGLAGGGSSTSQSRTVTPGTNGTGRLSNNTTPAPPTATAKLSGNGGDAFSDLFSSSSRNGKNNENMTLAARLAMESKAKQRQLGGAHSAQNTATGAAGGSSGLDAWAGLDTLASGGISLGVGNVTNANVKVKVDDVDDWGLGDFGSGNTSTATSTARSTATPQSNFDSRPTAPSTSKKGASLWDLDDFAQPPASSITLSTSTQPREEKKDDFEFGFDSLASPDRDFDFGSREDRDGGREGSRGLLDDDDNGERHDYREVHGNIPRSSRGGTQNEDEDDILGMLSKPVDVVRDTHTRTRTQNHDPIPQPSRRPPGRASSPPPHILGQIVEMGFSVQQAREALRVTKDGRDVQAAIESLLNGGGGSSRQLSSAPTNATTNGVPPRPRGLPKGQKERERERLERERERQRLETSSSPASGSTSQIQPSVAEIQEQADKLLAQASEIGRGMFSKATAFWREGKEKVVKAYEERGVVGDRPGSRGVGGGKPRWMIEAMEREREQAERDRGLGNVTGGFTDDDDHEEEAGRLWQQREQQQQQGGPIPEVHKIMQVEAEAEIDLFSNEVTVPVQPTRQVSSASSSNRANPPAPAPSRIPVPQRMLVSASHTTLTQALMHKSQGTELFKLGQHAAAVEAYTASIDLLPKSHLLLVPLLTNRALARLKTGEYAGVVSDCLIAVGVVVGGDDGIKDRGTVGDDFGVDDPLAPKKSTSIRAPTVLDVSALPPDLIQAGKSKLNDGGWRHPQGIGVDLVDGYVKAVKRAAEALEGREKWEEAGVWWGVLGRVGEAGWLDEKIKKETMGAGVRCRKMVEGSASAGSVTTSKSKPKPASRRPPIATTTASSSEPSKALQALKHSTAQAEAEDNAKHELKDIVDARIEKWKAGKEGNIRALLASLESVLWEGTSGVEGLRMGMKDVVSPAQVKKGYVKAIARVHPDKLNANNSTVEQRMLANGVFGTLNEAWISFQGTQK